MPAADLTTYTNGNFISSEVALALEKRLTSLSDWTWDVKNELSAPGSTITVNYVGTVPSAATKSVSGSYASSNFALVGVPLTFSDIDYVQVEVQEQDFINSGNEASLKNTIVDTVTKQLAKKIEDRAMALMLSSNFSSGINVGASSAYTFAAFRSNVGSGFAAGFDNPAVLLTSPYYAAVEAGQGYWGRTSNGAFDDGSRLIRSDRLITTNSLIGAIADKSAIVIGARRFAPDAGLSYGAITSKVLDSGVEVRMSLFRDIQTTGKTFFRAEVLMQAVRGNPAGLIRLTSA